MNHFISAIQFLTILPVRQSGEFNPGRMIQYFPMVGLVLGILVCLFDMAAGLLWSRPVVSILDVVVLAVLTGAFHIDGLGDSADGLLGHRPREKALLIMKDSRIGAMGLVAIVLGLAVKWGGIMGMDAHRWLFLIAIPAYARGGMLFGIRFLEYGRPGGGTGHAFCQTRPGLGDFWVFIIPVVIVLFTGWRGLVLNLGFAAIIMIMLTYYKRRMGCITGDMMGAMCEITEAMLFLLVSMGGGP